MDLERNLGVLGTLGTLGNNAPFIGLFGTELGIMKAFADLSRNQLGGVAAVMSGISEALVATAVGLMVAIPAVIAFNRRDGAPLALDYPDPRDRRRSRGSGPLPMMTWTSRCVQRYADGTPADAHFRSGSPE
jgi:hypothetical protein